MRIAASLVCASMVWIAFGPLLAQDRPIGFLEKFALASDRSLPLQDLIPGSEDFFFYHCLNFQNQNKLAEAEAILSQWANALPTGQSFLQMQFRQRLLNFDADPQASIDMVTNTFGVNLNHAPPQADRARDLVTALDPSLLDRAKLLDQAIVEDPSLSRVRDSALPELLDRKLTMDQIRILLQRIKRVDLPGLVPLIEQELRSKDTRGWNAFPIHAHLTLEQRKSLAKSLPSLLEHDGFVRQYLQRLLPIDDTAADDIQVKRDHLQRLEDFTTSLPASQNSLKAHVLFQRLSLDAASENYDFNRFDRYLALPRNRWYYNQEFLKNNSRTPLVDLGANYGGETKIGPIADNDLGLIHRYLERFFQTTDSIDRFAKWIDRGYLESIRIETRILYGLGSSASLYSKLTPQQQKALRDRTELRFSDTAARYYLPSAPVQLPVDIKNVSKLIVRVYQINPCNVFRKNGGQVSTDIDLDGLVANAERTINYDIPADRRHRERIDFPECNGRGIWVIDMLGGGLRSRALVAKGQLRSIQRLTDAGHEFRIFDESGKHVPTAHIELGSLTFSSDKDGNILIPFGEEDKTVPILLVDGQSASVENFYHRKESYSLEMGLLVDSQNLVSGARGSLVIRPQLLGNGGPVPINILDKPQLTITTTDQDGIQSIQTVTSFKLEADRESIHPFLVPQRLATLRVELSGNLKFESKMIVGAVRAERTMQFNEFGKSARIADFYLVQDTRGYRVQVRGRNGEAIPRLPIYVQLETDSLNVPVTSTLASDANGQIQLGKLPDVVRLKVSSDGIPERHFSLRNDIADWPSSLQLKAGESIQFPWIQVDTNKSAVNLNDWSLLEMRGDQVVADWSRKVKLQEGRLHVAALEPGIYFLTDHRSGLVSKIRVAEGMIQGPFLLAGSQSMEVSPPTVASVVKQEVKDGKRRIQIAGATPDTRVHFLATPFVTDPSFAARMRTSQPSVTRQPFAPIPSYYVDSLKLDEEYQYVLQRQYATKYPGNLLSQPSLLLNPWDTASTTNGDPSAASGDDIPPSPALPQSEAVAEFARPGMSQTTAETSLFEFLAASGVLVANRIPDKDGWIELPDGLRGYHTLTAVVVQWNGISSTTLSLPESNIPTTDLRLAKSFDAQKNLAQLQQVRILDAGKPTDLGDAKSTRVQLFTSQADLYRFYSTLLPQSELQKFQRIASWHQLDDAGKIEIYGELACHELHFFLAMKDRPFFDKIVRPYLKNKQSKQIVDLYLLNEDLTKSMDLWQRGRLNSLERILLADRIATARPGIRKWFADAVAAQPITAEQRMQKFLAALASTSNDLSDRTRLAIVMSAPQETADFSLGLWGAMGTRNGAVPSDSPMSGNASDLFGDASGARFDKDANFAYESEGRIEELSEEAAGMAGMGEGSGGMGGGMGGGGFGGPGGVPARVSRRRAEYRKMLFQSLDATREWAESQYYRTALNTQGPNLIPVSPLWNQLAKQDSLDGFLSTEIHLSANTLSEAVMAMAVLDLPLETADPKIEVQDGRVVVTSHARSIAFVETVDEVPKEEKELGNSILVGQDIYPIDWNPTQASLELNQSETGPGSRLAGQNLVRGVPYRAEVIVTNPTAIPRSMAILWQIPEGAIPLEAGKIVQSKPLELAPYSTQQFKYAFYFPAAGEFKHYGAQVSIAGKHVASVSSRSLKVLDLPEANNNGTWSYVASWGTNDEVLSFLKTKNVQKLDLESIAFRLQDKAFFVKCLDELDAQGIFHPALWAYSLLHRDAQRIHQFLSQHPDIATWVGPVFKSPLLQVDSADRYSYEHLDYRPLVNARSHLLGSQRVILNDKLSAQYKTLISRIAFRNTLDADHRLALTYYMLLQNRIEEAIGLFESVAAESVESRLQYDYMDAYLDFFRGRYDRAAGIAEKYSDYGVARWRELFAEIKRQVRQRAAMTQGSEASIAQAVLAESSDPIQRLLLDSRQSQQGEMAARSPSLDLKQQDGKLVLLHQNLKQVEVRFFLMDIELLFSRNPFVQQSQASIAIQPNSRQTLELGDLRGKQELELPKDLNNRNIVVEVQAGAIIDTEVVYANSMDVTVVDSFGRLQATTNGGKPVETAYVKVYARHHDGSVRFFKDGYTDLRGQFDYATLSTDELNTVQRLAILVVHPDRGALIREAAPPKQ